MQETLPRRRLRAVRPDVRTCANVTVVDDASHPVQKETAAYQPIPEISNFLDENGNSRILAIWIRRFRPERP